MPPDLIQEINNDFILYDPHAIKVLPHSVCKLVLALSPALLLPRHGWRHTSDGGARENKLVILFVEGSGCAQAVIMSVSFEDLGFKRRPLYLCLGVRAGVFQLCNELYSPQDLDQS